MGIERISRTTKLDPEIDLWLEGMRTNVFPWITKSALMNLLLGIMRDAVAAEDISQLQIAWQQLLRQYRVGRVPRKAEENEAKEESA